MKRFFEAEDDAGVSYYVAETVMFFLGPFILLFFIAIIVHCLWNLKISDALAGVGVVLFYCIQPSSSYRAAQLMPCVQLGPEADDWFLTSCCISLGDQPSVFYMFLTRHHAAAACL